MTRTDGHFVRDIWSGRPDLNRRPPVPQTGRMSVAMVPAMLGERGSRLSSDGYGYGGVGRMARNMAVRLGVRVTAGYAANLEGNVR